MNTTTIPFARACKLLSKKFIEFPRYAKYLIEDEPHPEAGFVASALLIVRNGECFLDGKLVTAEKTVKSGERTFIVSEVASPIQALQAAVDAVRDSWEKQARNYCATQDERFMGVYEG